MEANTRGTNPFRGMQIENCCCKEQPEKGSPPLSAAKVLESSWGVAPPVVQATGGRNQKQEVPSGERLGVKSKRLREAKNLLGSDLLGYFPR